KGKLHRLDAVFTSEFIVRDAADDVGTELDGFTHKFAAAIEGHDAELRKCHQLQINLPARFFTNLDQGPQRGEFGIAHVDVASNVLHAVGQLPAQDLADPALHVVDREVLDALAPHRDAFEQRARSVRPRL